MPVIRWLDNAPHKPLDAVGKFEKGWRTAVPTAVRGSMQTGKGLYLEGMAAQMPGKNLDALGFSHHKERFGKFFLVRSKVKVNVDGTTFGEVWAVPPGPYLLEKGAQPHSTKRGRGMTLRKGRRVIRFEGPSLGGHPGMKPKPWNGRANDILATYSRTTIQRAFTTATRKAVGL